MLTLYDALLAQHPRQLMPVRCAGQTISQLHRYFEDVVLENNLAALVVEGLPHAAERSLREQSRVREVGRASRHAFFLVSPEDALNKLSSLWNAEGREPVMFKLGGGQAVVEERFVIVADARFSALLASVPNRGGAGEAGGDEVIWTFEPDIVYSALEYLMARVTAECPAQSTLFSRAVRTCVPKATSLQLTVSVTTKLARLLQEQAVRELAINRIATAIRSSLELSSVLQKTVDEVGRALGAQHSALSVEGEHDDPPLVHCYFRDSRGEDADGEADREELVSDLNAYRVRLGSRIKAYVQDGCADGSAANAAGATRPVAAVPLIYRDRPVGVLMVRSDDVSRVWEENEILLMRTVADQVAVAVNHARLFEEMQQQALSDSLTGCPNRRSFEMQLGRDMQMATRMRHPLSLIMLDIDHFKRVNDTHGHAAGDAALRMIADGLRQELRGVDTAARYGGEEFAVILPQAGIEGALKVAERLRARVEALEIPGVGHVTASFGVATFPVHAGSRDLLVTTADAALYDAKHTGRNRVCVPPEAEAADAESPTAGADFGEAAEGVSLEEDDDGHAGEASVLISLEDVAM